ncbi:MAG: dihydrolipoamide dehydrogenase [Rhodospirillaceae bacterium]|nr:MAG: dihydrolipoamide dehydrogenase [Rhodospirillaceae bacterium]
MTTLLTPDICVIGAGSGGLSVTAGASQMGAETVLIERGKMGGDCLNTGCVPSKALLGAAHAAAAVRRAPLFGVQAGEPEIDFPAVQKHVQDVIAAIAPNDSVERFEGMGVNVLQEEAHFTGPREVFAGDTRIRARRFVIATGSRAAVPPIPGIKDVPYFTNETIFNNSELPEHLVVIGGGPIGIEMAQAHCLLGARVTVLEIASILPRDDPELVDLLRTLLRKDGLAIREGVNITRLEKKDGKICVMLKKKDGGEECIMASHLLIAAGRQVNVENLGLDAAGIAWHPKGISVNARLRTTNRRVYAIGDVAGGPQFTHVASYHAGIVIRNMLFRLPAKADTTNVPWVTYTTPELAHVGLSEREAKTATGSIRVLRWPFSENDRAQTERLTSGLVKIATDKKGRILGADILGPRAGELIQPWVLAIASGLKIGAMANAMAPYPTLGEASKRAAGSYYAPTLFGERTQKLVRFLAKFG